jgi:hypothetical protein
MSRDTIETTDYSPIISPGDGNSVHLTLDLSTFLGLLIRYKDKKIEFNSVEEMLVNSMQRLAKAESASDKEIIQTEIDNHKDRLDSMRTELHKIEKPLSTLHGKISSKCFEIFLIDDLLDAATLKLDPEMRNIVNNSTAVKILQANLGELFKNSFDAIITSYLEDRSSTPVVEIDIAIELSDRITLKIRDNGKGFPPSMLEQLSTKEGIDRYIDESMDKYARSTKHDKNAEKSYLFGGMGKGLQMFLAEATKGKKVGADDRSHALPLKLDEFSSIRITNNPGAQLEISSSFEKFRYVSSVEVESKVEVTPPTTLSLQKRRAGSKATETSASSASASSEDETVLKPFSLQLRAKTKHAAAVKKLSFFDLSERTAEETKESKETDSHKPN